MREEKRGSESDRKGAMDESTETAHIYVNAREPSVLCVYTSSNVLCFTNTVLANAVRRSPPRPSLFVMTRRLAAPATASIIGPDWHTININHVGRASI